MINIKTLTGKLTDLTRLPTSRNGNPRYVFVVDGRMIRTAVDCSYGYEIGNHRDKVVTVEAGDHRGHFTLHSITGA